jgi:hypothetical protein
VVVVVMVMPPARDAAAQHRRADAQHEQARDEVEPRVQVLGEHVLRQRQRDHAEQRDACGVRDGDRRSERDRLPRRSLRADEVGRDHRLPVPG